MSYPYSNRRPQEISPLRAQRILREILETLCDIANGTPAEEMTQLERNLLGAYTEPADALKPRCPWKTTVSHVRCDAEDGHDGPHRSREISDPADYSHGIWWKP